MSGFSQFEVQKAVYQALGADGTLMGMITGVFDRVPEKTAFPYVVIGDSGGRDWSTKTTTGMQVDMTIHIYSRAGGRKECAALMERVHSLLHEGDLSIAGQHLVTMRFDTSDIALQEDGLSYHGRIGFRLTTEAL